AVTARHVIDRIRDLSIDAQVYFRLNQRGGDAIEASMPLSDWVFHSDSRVDVAVAPLALEFANLDQLWLPTTVFLTDEMIKADGVGPGDELFFPGLFSRHVGTKSNIPIIRTGNIAAMPQEIMTKTGLATAYLAEARSIGGLSGSPVILPSGGVRKRDGKW